MHVILADSIDGGILAILIFGGGLAAALLALAGLFPAWHGSKLAALCLIAPAFIAGVAVTCWLAYCSKDVGHDPDFEFVHDILMPWIFLAGPALFTSLLAALVLLLRSRKIK